MGRGITSAKVNNLGGGARPFAVAQSFRTRSGLLTVRCCLPAAAQVLAGRMSTAVGAERVAGSARRRCVGSASGRRYAHRRVRQRPRLLANAHREAGVCWLIRRCDTPAFRHRANCRSARPTSLWHGRQTTVGTWAITLRRGAPPQRAPPMRSWSGAEKSRLIW